MIIIIDSKPRDPRQLLLEDNYIKYKTNDNDIENNIKWFKILDKEIVFKKYINGLIFNKLFKSTR